MLISSNLGAFSKDYMFNLISNYSSIMNENDYLQLHENIEKVYMILNEMKN